MFLSCGAKRLLGRLSGTLVLGMGFAGCAVAQVSNSNAESQLSQSQIQLGFKDVIASTGVRQQFITYGVAWTDYNGDRWPDLWIGNHISERSPLLYLNQGNGTFKNIASSALSVDPLDDTHAAAWADFDNDGDPDMLELVGAEHGQGIGPNHFFVNNGGMLENQAVEWGLAYPLGRGRTPLWLDYNRDGRLDVAMLNALRHEAPSAVFQQAVSNFVNVNELTGFQIDKHADFAQLADLSGDGIPELLVHGNPYPQRVYDLSTVPWTDIKPILGLPNIFQVRDVAIADFNGDLRPDLFLTVNDIQTSDYLQIDNFSMGARFAVKGDEKGLRFQSGGEARFLFDPKPALKEVFVGADCRSPAAIPVDLSAADPHVVGFCPHQPGVAKGVYIGHDPVSGQWEVLYSNPASKRMKVGIETTDQLDAVASIGFTPLHLRNVLLVYENGRYVDKTAQFGADVGTHCGSVVAADFDNDGDVDLFMVCGLSWVVRQANLLLENLSNKRFREVPDAGGAAGCGPCSMAGHFGRGPMIATADYDKDGFLDIFVASSTNRKLFDVASAALYRNHGNSNHWLEIDLEGILSNRDGIGSVVLAAAGGVAQRRDQGGGMHLYAQNHSRLHFGLGAQDRVDWLEIHWPSGIVQLLTDIPVDQVITVTEPEDAGIGAWFLPPYGAARP